MCMEPVKNFRQLLFSDKHAKVCELIQRAKKRKFHPVAGYVINIREYIKSRRTERQPVKMRGFYCRAQ
jgi:hypothetical protein